VEEACAGVCGDWAGAEEVFFFVFFAGFAAGTSISSITTTFLPGTTVA
jgi:hypothetical protein